LEWEVPVGVEEQHDDDVNEVDILELINNDIEFYVHNIDGMQCGETRR
jgi:hypothetical protein